jgi:hypothetical protein
MADNDETALDVWLRFHSDDSDDADAEAECEANTYATDDGFRVDWSHTAVGLVTSVNFDTLAEAHAWLEANDFQDFTS